MDSTLSDKKLHSILDKLNPDLRSVEDVNGKVVSVFAIRNFRFLGFVVGKGRNGIYHAKSLKKAKAKLKELTSRSQGRKIQQVMEKENAYIRGWLGYYGIASIKTTLQEWDKWLRRRYRCYI